MDKYPHFTIGELCKIEKGETGLASAAPGEYPLVNTGAERKSCKTYQFDTEAVCIPLVSSTGHGKKTLNYVHYQRGKFALGTILAAVIPKEHKKLSAAFLHRYLQFYKDRKIVPLMKGAANVSLAIKDIAKINIPLPPINEQNSFIELFNKLDGTSKKLQSEFLRQLSYLALLRQTVLQEAIEGKLTAEWRKKNHKLISGENHASKMLDKIKAEKEQLIKERKIKKENTQEPAYSLPINIPKDWIQCRLVDISKQVTDGTHQTPTYVKEGEIFLSAQNVKPFKFMPDNHQFITRAAFDLNRKNRVPEKDDLLVARVGAGIGETAVIDQNIDFAFYVSLGLVKIFKQWINPNYLALVFNSPYGVSYAKRNISSQGTSAGNYNLGRIRAFEIPLPSVYEQQAIVERVDKLMTIINELEKQVNERKDYSERLMQSVLREAFEDKV